MARKNVSQLQFVNLSTYFQLIYPATKLSLPLNIAINCRDEELIIKLQDCAKSLYGIVVAQD